MIRASIVFLVLVAAALGAVWLVDHSGHVAVSWGTHELRLATETAVLGLLVLLVAAVVIYRIWHFLSHSPMALASFRRESRRKRGYKALSRGLVAVAAGDAKEASKLARQTADLLDDRRLALLLSAQAAQLNGDEAGARRFFEAMRDEPDTEFLGLRGLLVQARRAGRDGEALALARRAYELRPTTPWVLQELFALESQNGEYAAALKVLDQSNKQQGLSVEELRRRRGVLHLAAAQAAEAGGNSSQAIAEARKALDQIPGLTPAAALAARLHIAAGDVRKARKLLEQAWAITPHRDLMAIYATLPGKSSDTEQMKQLERFAGANADDPESRIALAQVALAAGDLVETRAQLAPLTADPVAVDVCRLMAELEEQSGDGRAAAEWLRRAADAPGPSGWYCRDCGHHDSDWSLHCPSCGAFDSQEWRRPNGAPAPVVLVNEVPADSSVERNEDDDDRPGQHEKIRMGDIAPTATRA